MIFFYITLLINFFLLFIKTPLSLALMIISQTLMFSLIMNFNLNLYWISYILYLIMLGGMLILFLYMCSISSNEIVKLNVKILLSSLPIILMYFFFWMSNKSYQLMNSPNFLMNNENLISIHKIYNNFTLLISFLLMFYLLITLFMVTSLSYYNFGPLRASS
uniref:NADH dehydrogenase subunit 6 n=1 Tax=Potamyia chinensis TaxID=1875907 RepID=UPI0022377133|nr:NADH dehydrogenase subunit 6 [Potamyia chinensis]UYO79419.1 NADH dehydrogenase subunit 6 [Potamyia chinensis]